MTISLTFLSCVSNVKTGFKVELLHESLRRNSVLQTCPLNQLSISPSNPLSVSRLRISLIKREQIWAQVPDVKAFLLHYILYIYMFKCYLPPEFCVLLQINKDVCRSLNAVIYVLIIGIQQFPLPFSPSLSGSLHHFFGRWFCTCCIFSLCKRK